MGALQIEKKIGTALQTALTDQTSAAQALIAAYVWYATESNVQRYDVLWVDGEWTIDGLAVDEWADAMTVEEA